MIRLRVRMMRWVDVSDPASYSVITFVPSYSSCCGCVKLKIQSHHGDLRHPFFLLVS